jgi:hypothetical protein
MTRGSPAESAAALGGGAGCPAGWPGLGKLSPWPTTTPDTVSRAKIPANASSDLMAVLLCRWAGVPWRNLPILDLDPNPGTA